MKLAELQTSESGRITGVGGEGAFRKRILEMGFISGQEVKVIQNAPLKDPVYYRIMGYNVSLRRKDAELVEVVKISPNKAKETAESPEAKASVREELPTTANTLEQDASLQARHTRDDKERRQPKAALKSKPEKGKSLRVAMVGNPNSGKTSIFNIASGAHEKVGNYSGVTIDAHEAHFNYGGYRIDIVDLPGSYSLSPYSPEELFIRSYLTNPNTRPDLVVDVVDTTNLERNLYLTIQLKELGIPMVVALNMFDEFRRSGSKLDVKMLSKLLDTPMVPTIGRVSEGINELLGEVVRMYETSQLDEEGGREIRISYGTVLEPAVQALTEKCSTMLSLPSDIPPRYIAVKLLEGDSHTKKFVSSLKKGDFILSACKYELEKAQKLLGEKNVETVITDQRYGFISGALRETYMPHHSKARSLTDRLDQLLLNRFIGFPIFILFLLLMFQSTFTLGAYPQGWIEALVEWCGSGVASIMPEGPFTDMLVDGIISGVGGVIVFLPQIIILYFFISIMEDTGYMARAAFIMDKLMHGMGLHGKSFIPLIMGFGCNVPAIMATRTIESRQSRLITILVNPLISCSARLPVYVLLAGAFFPRQAGWVLFSLYALGILLAILMAWLFRKSMFKKEDLPFVMELPPYRMPTSKSVLIHMWDKSKQYLTKMGTVILLASIIIWFLGYFPRQGVMEEADAKIAMIETNEHLDETEKEGLSREIEAEAKKEQQRTSYLGRIGRGIEPAMAPLGFDWKMSIAIASGLPAKEVVVSTLGVIYTGDSDDSDEAAQRLSEKLRNDVDKEGKNTFTPLIAFTFMVFVLIYFPCIASVAAVGREAGGWQWALLLVVYTCALAWLVSFLVYRGGLLLGLG